DHIDLTPNPLTIIPNRPTALAAAPRDSANALVLVAPSSLMWTALTASVASVDSSGVVTGLAFGDSDVRVVDTESGKVATTTVHVVPPIVISPANPTVSIHDRVTFTAAVTGLPNTNVTWSVAEGPSGGTIASDGDYTAPGASGAFPVVATSAAN